MASTSESDSITDRLNADCFCIGTDLDLLHTGLDQDLRPLGLAAPILETHAHLFSSTPVFVDREHLDAMVRYIAAVESVVAMPAWQERVLAAAPEIARVVPAAQGILQGYDFHLTPDGPKLIEINTNAGGAMLNLALIRAQRACCDALADLFPGPEAVCTGQQLVGMFLAEWRRARGGASLGRIAIVDAAPETQYLYPELLLFQQLFEERGIEAVIVDPSALDFDAGGLHDGHGPIDLVYNRLTDFHLDAPESAALREAVRAGVVVVPNPHEHALYANKRNLALISDAEALEALAVDPETIDLLTDVTPRTRVVDPRNADDLWAMRRKLFFKPVSGFGSRGSYRGDKLTRKVFARILEQDYVAQALVPPGLRHQPADREGPPLKFDVRVYVHRGRPLLVAARLYRGQTTNFRTAGGGFAPVYHAPEAVPPDLAPQQEQAMDCGPLR